MSETPNAWTPGVETDPPFLPETPLRAVADEGWQDTKPRPWRRYAARMIDTMVAAVILGVAVVAFVGIGGDSPLGDSDNPVVHVLAIAAVAVPYQALLLGLTGTTIGKWVMGVRITRRHGKGIGFSAALRRELHVWSAGMCFGIPLLHLITQALSYSKLKAEGATSWDRGQDWVVTHRPSGIKQVVLGAVGVTAALATYLALKSLSD